MNNLLIIICNEFDNGYYCMGKTLYKFFNNINILPLYEFMKCAELCNNSNNSYIDDIERIIKGEKCINDYVNLSVNNMQITHILIWFNFNQILYENKINNISIFEIIKNFKIKYNFKLNIINWDVDLQSKYNYNFIENEIINHCDNVFVANPYFEINNKCKYFKQGFSKKFSNKVIDDTYKCDVSFVGTNLYTDEIWPNKNVNRKNVLDLIYGIKDIKLNIYGSTFLNNLYPKSYKGYIKYNDAKYVFSNSLINLNISPINNDDCAYNNKYYFSERLPQILACDGVMLCNNDFTGLLNPNEDYIYIDNLDDFINKIKYYLNNKDELEKIRINFRKKLYLFNANTEFKKIGNIMLN